MEFKSENIDLSKIIKRDKYDFEIGYITKSPCLECRQYEDMFPKCISDCKIIDLMQTILAAGISSSK